MTTEETGPAKIGYPSVAQAFAAADGVPALPTVAAVLSGHVHLLQYSALAGHPVQLVAGFSGTQEDYPPAPLNAQAALPGGLTLEDLATTAGPFGYVLLERMDGGAWRMTAHDLDGKVLLSRVVKRRGA